jgi:hypothetical protein
MTGRVHLQVMVVTADRRCAMLVVLERDETSSGNPVYVAGRPGLRDRARARMSVRRLDAALANAECPESTAALAIRARRVTSDAMRRRMAHGFQRVVTSARTDARSRSVHPRVAAMAFSRERVLAAATEFDALVEGLLAPGPISAFGAARAFLLLTDGAGPLFNRSCGDLGGYLRAAIDGLDPVAPWLEI